MLQLRLPRRFVLPPVNSAGIKGSKQSSELTGLLSSAGIRAQLHREAPELSFATSPLEIKIKLKCVNAEFAAAVLGFEFLMLQVSGSLEV